MTSINPNQVECPAEVLNLASTRATGCRPGSTGTRAKRCPTPAPGPIKLIRHCLLINCLTGNAVFARPVIIVNMNIVCFFDFLLSSELVVIDEKFVI